MLGADRKNILWLQKGLQKFLGPVLSLSHHTNFTGVSGASLAVGKGILYLSFCLGSE